MKSSTPLTTDVSCDVKGAGIQAWDGLSNALSHPACSQLEGQGSAAQSLGLGLHITEKLLLLPLKPTPHLHAHTEHRFTRIRLKETEGEMRKGKAMESRSKSNIIWQLCLEKLIVLQHFKRMEVDGEGKRERKGSVEIQELPSTFYPQSKARLRNKEKHNMLLMTFPLNTNI